MLLDKINKLIYKSINESFDFGDIECTVLDDTMDEYSSEAAAAFNKEINIK